MKPLIVLLIVFIISCLYIKIKVGKYTFPLPARIAMSAMLLFTAMGHFKFPEGMAMMIPASLPYRVELVFITGVLEISAAVGLLIQKLKFTTAWILIAFFIVILPANIYAALNHIDFVTASFNGSNVSYLWFRVPLQVFFITWVYFSAIKPKIKSKKIANKS